MTGQCFSARTLLVAGLMLLPVLCAKAQDNHARYALLVGCTTYEHLEEALHLRGPANDVVLMRQVLTERFKFPAENVVTLADHEGGQKLPTRANIEREFQRLAKVVKARDQVVILMAGHGTQQPDSGDDPQDREPDGLDEVFLPRDISGWEGGRQAIKNAIVDDDLGRWLQAIRQQGAFVWIIVDSCHSGTIIRGNEEESLRQIPPERLIPKAVLDQIPQSRGTGETAAELSGGTAGRGGIVAIYAAQPTEPTIEKRLPPGAQDRKSFGLLTYTLAKILTEARTPLSYRELSQRIYAQYVSWGRVFPTPLIEGDGLDREVLGQRQLDNAPRIRLKQVGVGWHIDAGELAGLTAGSILAVHEVDAGDRKPVGYVRISQLNMLTAQVVPCEFAGVTGAKLPAAAYCEPEVVDFGIDRLQVAVDRKGADQQPISDANFRRLEQAVVKAEKGQRSLVKLVPFEQGQWLLRQAAGPILLIPASGLPGNSGPGGAFKINSVAEIDERLRLVARAQHLLQLTAHAASPAVRGQSGLAMKTTIHRLAANGDEQEIQWGTGGITFRPKDRLEVRVANPTRFTADVTLLYLDSNHGISCLFPNVGELNRLASKDKIAISIEFTPDTVGLEHLIVLAVKGSGQPVDFGFLAQPSLERAQQAVTVRGAPGETGFNSPFGKLLQTAVYGESSLRGIRRMVLADHDLQLLSWHVVPEPRLR